MKYRKIFGLSANIFLLGLISLLTDISSEMIFTLVPLFLTNVIGASTIIVGVVEGVAESAASLLKVFSGWFSDKIKKRKIITFIGYGLSTLVKPLMYIAGSWGLVLGIRFGDRVGKGIRSAPRDALVADSLKANERGKGFGIHRAMDTAGAALGLIAAAVIVLLLQGQRLQLDIGTYQMLVIIGTVPAVLALFVFFYVRDVRKNVAVKGINDNTIEITDSVKTGNKKITKIKLSTEFYLFLIIVFIFTLGNSSDAFLILRAQNAGNCISDILFMLVVFNISYALFSVPAGIVSDKISRKYVIALGWFIYALTYLGLATFSASWQIWLLFILYGVYYGLSEGVARAYVADLVPEESRGTAYGIFHGVVGITLLPASILAGWLWQTISPSAAFYLGAILSAIAIIALLVLFRRK
jgi:MFS family permease